MVAPKLTAPVVVATAPARVVGPAVRVKPAVKVNASLLALPNATLPVLAKVTALVTVVFEPFKAKLKLPAAALRLLAYKSLLNAIVPVVAVNAILLTRSPSAPTAPWKVAPPDRVTVIAPMSVPIAPCTSTAPVTLKVTLEESATPPAVPVMEASVTLLEPPVPTVKVVLSAIVVAPRVIAPLPEDKVALLETVVAPSVRAVLVVETLPTIVLALLVLDKPPVKVWPPPKVTPLVLSKVVVELMVPAPLIVKA